MSLASLLPIGGAAVGVLAARTLSHLAEHFPFKSHLEEKPNSQEVPSAPQPQVSLNLADAVPQFVANLRDRFQAAGINLSQPLVLKDNGNGGVLVEGDHSDRSTIEGILAEDPELLAEFQAIAAAAQERRQMQAPGHDNAFGEFRLSLTHDSVAIRFE